MTTSCKKRSFQKDKILEDMITDNSTEMDVLLRTVEYFFQRYETFQIAENYSDYMMILKLHILRFKAKELSSYEILVRTKDISEVLPKLKLSEIVLFLDFLDHNCLSGGYILTYSITVYSISL